MRLTARFGIGAAAAILPLVGVVAFSVDRMQTLSRSNQRLAERSVLGLEIGVGVMARLERIDEYERKRLISKDGTYARLVRDTLAATAAELTRLRGVQWSPTEQAALDRLVGAFEAFETTTLAAVDRGAAPAPAADRDALIALATDLQQQMRAAAEAETVEASRARERTWHTALWAAGGAAVVSAAALWLIVRALRARLAQFIDGARAVSSGTFSYQIDAARDDELDRAAAAFNQMVDALSELERAKADFISSVSHELRTPLVAVQETTHLLLDEVVGPLTPRQRQMLELSSEAGQRLARMIAELLDLSRLKARALDTGVEDDLARLTRTAVSQLEPVALEREIDLRTRIAADDLSTRCDPDRYVQVVQNLVENALKHTPRGGVIEVHLDCRAASGMPPAAGVGDHPRSCALLRVEDSGPGIPDADRERVFEKFFRRGGMSDGGAGLGLAICREIVEAHGGSVWIEDAPELGGAALNVALPLTRGVPKCA